MGVGLLLFVMEVQDRLPQKIKTIIKAHTLSEQENDKLNQLASQSDYKPPSTLLPQLQTLFPSLFKTDPHPSFQTPKIKSQQKLVTTEIQAEKQQGLVPALHDEKRETQKQLAMPQTPVQIKNEVKIRINNKYALVSIKVNSHIQVREGVSPEPDQRHKRQQKQREEQLESSDTVTRTIEQYSDFDYVPIDDPDYIPAMEPEDQIERLMNAISTNLNDEISTAQRYDLMFQTYTSTGGQKSFKEFQDKLIQDLLFITSIQFKKPGFRTLRSN